MTPASEEKITFALKLSISNRSNIKELKRWIEVRSNAGPPRPIFKGSPSANRQKHRPFLMQRRVNSNSPPNILKILCCTNLPKYPKIRCCTQPFLKQLFVSSVGTWEEPLEPSSFRYFFDRRHPWQHSSCHLHSPLFTRFAVMKSFLVLPFLSDLFARYSQFWAG